MAEKQDLSGVEQKFEEIFGPYQISKKVMNEENDWDLPPMPLDTQVSSGVKH